MATRREKVILELEDNFTSGMARAAAATAILDKNLNSLSGSAVQSDRELERTRKSVGGIGDEVDRTTQSTRRGGQEIDRYSGRLRLLTEAAVTLGPALIPLGGAAIPALAALTAGLGAAAGAAGVALLAFNGMGDALKAIDAYQLEPTTKNLDKMRETLDELGPAGAEFARYLDSLDPAIKQLQNEARAGLFPGLEESIDNLLPLLPQVEQIISKIATSLGDLGADAGGALAGERFTGFFDYLEQDAAPTMEAFARSTGNVIEGLADLLVAFGPLTNDFTGGMERMTRSFADWAANLSKTDGFREFVAYVRESGPQVVEFLGAIGDAFVGVVRAAAPFGQAVLPALTALADVLAAIANSPVGPPLFTAAAGFLAVSRASTIAAAGVERFNLASARLGGGAGGLGLASKVTGIAAAFGILGNEFAKLNGSKVNLSKLDEQLEAIASGGGADSIDQITNSLKTLGDTMPDAYEVPTIGGLFGNTPKDNAADYIESVDQKLAAMVASGNAEKAAKIFAQIQEARTGLSADTHQFAPFGDSAKEFDAYASALSGAAEGTAALSAANQDAGAAARQTRTEIKGLIAAMEEQRSTALGAFDALTQYGQAVDDAAAAAKKGKRGIDEATEGGRENRTALAGLAATWNNLSAAQQNSSGKFKEAKRNFIDTATAMGVPIEKARTLAKRLLEIPKSTVAEVSADTGAANRNLNVLYARLAEINGTHATTYIDVVTRSFNAKRAGIPQPGQSADGGTVPKTGLPYADRHHYLLADGEEVISNRRGQADRYRPLLKAINNAADGATVGGGRSIFTQSGEIGGYAPRNIPDAVEAIGDLRVTIRRLNAGIRESERTIKRETKERDRLAKTVDKNQAEVDRLNGLYDNLASAVSSNLAADQFATKRSGLLAGSKDRPPTFGEILGSLSKSTANADAMVAANGTLSHSLSGDALESVLRQGLGTTQMFANLPAEMLAQYQAAFDANAVAVGAAGAAAGTSVYGADQEKANAALAKSQQALQEQNVELRLLTRQGRVAEQQRDKAEKALGQVKDILAGMRSDAKTHHKDAQRGRHDAAERTGSAVGAAVNGPAVRAGQRRTAKPKITGVR